jgi:HSP20 family protein
LTNERNYTILLSKNNKKEKRRYKMMIVKWSPTKNLRWFDTFYKDSQKEQDNEACISWSPAADIYDTNDDYVVKLEVPGLSKKDVKIEVENDTLSVSGERKRDNGVKKDELKWAESHSGKFYRAFRLPKNIDSKKINASMKDGILELRVPKPEVIKPKHIPITVH